jgi:hypothetical protein
MYLFFRWGWTYQFGWGEIHNEGHLKGVGNEIEIFLGPEMATSLRVPFGPKKVEISGPTPSNGPPHINNRKKICLMPFLVQKETQNAPFGQFSTRDSSSGDSMPISLMGACGKEKVTIDLSPPPQKKNQII